MTEVVESVSVKTVILTAADVEAIPSSAAGKKEGVATLDSSGKLPAEQLPSSVVTGSAEGIAKKGFVLLSNGTGNGVVTVLQRINVLALGAVPGTDCSTVVLSAIAQYHAEGITNFCLYFPAASEPYKLALGTLGEAAARKGVCVMLEGDGRLASWIAPAKSEEPILTIEGPADATNVGFTIMDLGIELIGHRRYDKPLFQVNFARDFSYERIAIRGAGETNYTGTIFSHESAYEGSLRSFAVLDGSKYIVPFVHTNEKIPTGQTEAPVCDNFKFDRCTFTVMGPVFRNAQNQIHNIEVSSFKVLQSSYYNPATALTTLVKEAKESETKIEVASVSGLEAGDFMVVGHDALKQKADFVRVTAIAGKVLTLASTTPLLQTHASGAEVMQGGIGLTLGDNVVSATLIGPHLEHCLSGIALGTTQDVTLINPYSTSAYVIRRCGNDKRTTIISGQLTGSTVANALQSTAADNPATELGETVILGTFSEQSGAVHEMSLLPGSSTPYTSVYKDAKGSWTIRRNVSSSGEVGKDRAYEITRGNATTAKF